MLLDSHMHAGVNQHEYDWIAAGKATAEFEPQSDVFTSLREARKKYNGWWFGRFNYDVKNSIEDLSSDQPARLGWSDVYFFEPAWVVTSKAGEIILHLKDEVEQTVESWLQELNETKTSQFQGQAVVLTPGMTRDQYIESAQSLLDHIQRGDIYEVNFCQEYFADNVDINPNDLYEELYEVASPPMSALWHRDHEWAISMSPERYIKKVGNRLISQPIKGTAKRSADPAEDWQISMELKNNPKEQAENVMIVDLVRNDLSRVAERGSVEVSELFGIYSFQTVHQMISTVEANLEAGKDIWSVIEASFPMGSMTGAPKVSAMKLIEEFENHKRELYSGSIGYITPNNDFDFSVIIRTVLYDSVKKALSVSVGSALTSAATPHAEYEECDLKLAAIREVLLNHSLNRE